MPYDTTLAPPPPPPIPMPMSKPKSKPIAHWTHTAALLAFLIGYAVLGHNRAQPAPDSGSHVPRYIATIVLEWLLLGSVIAGIYCRRQFFATAFASRVYSIATSLALGLAVYVAGFFAMGLAVLTVYFTPFFHKPDQAVVLAMLPHTHAEFFTWFLVSLTAGVVEELIFRGYLLQQLTAWTARPVVAILIAGILFGCLHLYEGVGAIVPLAALGIFYGFVARLFKGDLRMVIVAHTLQDFLVALFALARPFLERYQPHP